MECGARDSMADVAIFPIVPLPGVAITAKRS
jgi:hypothetical protein